MIGPVLDTVVPWKMRRVRFPDQGTDRAAATTRSIVDVFLAGARTGFRDYEPDETRTEEQPIPPLQRPFFWEGRALGLSARHAFTRADENPDRRFQGPGFRFMLYTGIGFWNGLAHDYWLPQVSLDPDRWRDVDDFEGCRPLIAGGTSFAVVTVLGRVDPGAIARLDREEIPWWRHGLYQGVGRGVWFLYMDHPQRIAHTLQAAGDDAAALAVGLGLAIMYTQLSAPLGVLSALQGLPERFQGSARAGCRLCLAAAGADDPRIATTLAALPAPLDRWFVEGTEALAHAGRGPDMAARLHDALYTHS